MKFLKNMIFPVFSCSILIYLKINFYIKENLYWMIFILNNISLLRIYCIRPTLSFKLNFQVVKSDIGQTKIEKFTITQYLLRIYIFTAYWSFQIEFLSSKIRYWSDEIFFYLSEQCRKRISFRINGDIASSFNPI